MLDISLKQLYEYLTNKFLQVIVWYVVGNQIKWFLLSKTMKLTINNYSNIILGSRYIA
jgi:hypothetical protein